MAPIDAGDVVERVRDMILQQDDASAYAAHSSQLSGIISLVQSAMHGELEALLGFSRYCELVAL
jgi:hypothetical protein